MAKISRDGGATNADLDTTIHEQLREHVEEPARQTTGGEPPIGDFVPAQADELAEQGEPEQVSAEQQGGTIEKTGGVLGGSPLTTSPNDELERPSKRASVDDWRAYVVERGLATEVTAAGWSKDECISVADSVDDQAGV